MSMHVTSVVLCLKPETADNFEGNFDLLFFMFDN